MKSGMHPSSTVTVLPQGATSALLCLLRYRLATQNISNLICGGELGSAAVADCLRSSGVLSLERVRPCRMPAARSFPASTRYADMEGSVN